MVDQAFWTIGVATSCLGAVLTLFALALLTGRFSKWAATVIVDQTYQCFANINAIRQWDKAGRPDFSEINDFRLWRDDLKLMDGMATEP